MKKLNKFWKLYWKVVGGFYIFIGVGTLMGNIVKHPGWYPMKLWRKTVNKAWKNMCKWYEGLMNLIVATIGNV